MSARTVRGPSFTIVVDGKRIFVKHVDCKGKRCRVIAPEGVTIEECRRRPTPHDAPVSGPCYETP
jgi:hypothetical protein